LPKQDPAIAADGIGLANVGRFSTCHIERRNTALNLLKQEEGDSICECAMTAFLLYFTWGALRANFNDSKGKVKKKIHYVLLISGNWFGS
jgi:hypothetical protein